MIENGLRQASEENVETSVRAGEGLESQCKVTSEVNLTQEALGKVHRRH